MINQSLSALLQDQIRDYKRSTAPSREPDAEGTYDVALNEITWNMRFYKKANAECLNFRINWTSNMGQSLTAFYNTGVVDPQDPDVQFQYQEFCQTCRHMCSYLGITVGDILDNNDVDQMVSALNQQKPSNMTLRIERNGNFNNYIIEPVEITAQPSTPVSQSIHTQPVTQQPQAAPTLQQPVQAQPQQQVQVQPDPAAQFQQYQQPVQQAQPIQQVQQPVQQQVQQPVMQQPGPAPLPDGQLAHGIPDGTGPDVVFNAQGQPTAYHHPLPMGMEVNFGGGRFTVSTVDQNNKVYGLYTPGEELRPAQFAQVTI